MTGRARDQALSAMTGAIQKREDAESLLNDFAREAIAVERAANVEGIKSYFAPSDDPLYEDVRILCDRITRGEYGSMPPNPQPATGG